MSTPRCQCARETVASQRPRHSVVISYALHRKRQGAPKSAARGEPAEDLHPQLLTQDKGCDREANALSGGLGRDGLPTRIHVNHRGGVLGFDVPRRAVGAR